MKQQIKLLKREIKSSTDKSDQDQDSSKQQKLSETELPKKEFNEILEDFHEQHKKYAEVKTVRRGKGKTGQPFR